MKELRLLAIIVCVLQSLDFVETICAHPFGAGTFITSTRGTWTTTNTMIANYRFFIGAYGMTINLTCYTQNNTNRYVFYNYYKIFNNIFMNIYTCLDIRNSTSDRHYVYEATEFGWTGDYFTADSTNVCNRANYLTAVETTVVIRQGAYSRSRINCPNIILGNYTYNTTDDYSDMDSCNNMQQLTFKKNKATYVALSSGGNLACMYSGTGDYVYLITFNNDVNVDSKNTYQFTCFAFSFSGFGSVVYASQRPISCSSSQTPTSADSTEGKTFIFTPYVFNAVSTYVNKTSKIKAGNGQGNVTFAHIAILDTSIESKAAVDLDWVFGLMIIIVLVFITVIVITCIIFVKDKVSSRKPIIKLEEGQDSTPTPSPPTSVDRGMTHFDLQIETPSVQSFKGQDDTVEDKNVGGEEYLLQEDEVINLISGEPLPEDKEVINSIRRDTLPEEKEVAKMRGGEPILENGDEKLKEHIEIKSTTGNEILLDNIEESEKEKTKSFEEDKDHNDKGEIKTPMEVIMQEDLTLNQDDALGIFGFDGPLPPGYTSDKDGNIRVKDGNIVVTAQKKHELRNKIHHLFNVPHLIREDRGRPVGVNSSHA
ncbi:hypothetical protein ACJMK2_032622 [Sinanodonta woodiana]|uniref:Uncharacterized protein n=1 Tax=Sinanodonta woodiana TaxID=1069815 RepID=A0ABD3X6D1_SINWO